MRFQHKMASALDPAVVSKHLRDYEADGWELVTATVAVWKDDPLDEHHTMRWDLFFKRPAP